MPAKKPKQAMRLRPDVLYIFTDGSVDPNPGAGGWGVLLIWNGYRKVVMGGGKKETNNTMELQAILNGLRARSEDVPTRLFSDSQYCVNSITTWGDGWEKRGWLKRDGEPVKNKKLIQSIRKLLRPVHPNGYSIEIHWLKGHAGNDFNEMADFLARRGRDIYGLGLTEYRGDVDLSELNPAMAHLKKGGDPPFEVGEKDLPFPLAKFERIELNNEPPGVLTATVDGVAEEVLAAPPVEPVEEPIQAKKFNSELKRRMLREIKESRGLVRRAEEKLKALEKIIKEMGNAG